MLAARLARSTAARAALLRAGPARRAMATDAAAVSPDALETEVGISVFANSCKGFTAVLKHRWSDFIVSEIGLDGRVAALKLLPPRKAPDAAAAAPRDLAAAAAAGNGAGGGDVAAAAAAAGDAGDAAAAAAAAAREAEAAAAAAVAATEPPRPSPSDDPAAALAAFGAVVSAEETEALRAWISACAAAFRPTEGGGDAPPRRPQPPPPLLFAPTADKQLRTRLHGLVRAHLRWAESDVAEDGPGGTAAAKRIRLRCTYKGPAAGPKRARGAQGDRDAKRHRAIPQVIEVESGPGCREDALGSLPPYLSFVLMKENADSGSSLAALAALLHVPARTLGYAGTKDKRGVTAQRVTWRRGDVARLAALNARLIGMRVGAAERANAPLGLGALRGNRFAVTLRDVRGAAPADVAAALGALRARGFVNYFGLQRFGAGGPGSRTHSVGAALLRGAWPEAVDRLLGAPRPSDRPELAAARAAWAERRDARAALAGFPPSALAERAVLRRFAQPGWDGRNFVGALTAIPKTMRLMFVHAYQSYLWNHAAAVRVQRYGLEAAVEGDLIYEDWASDEYDDNGLVITAAAAQAAQAAAAGSDDDDDEDFGDDDGEAGEAASEAGRRVRHVTADEAAARSVPITAVLLPLPAAGVAYPANDVAEAYTSRAAADGVSLSGGQHSVREFSLSAFTGGYRRLLQRPGAMAWRLLRYGEPGQELARTPFGDALVLEGRRPPPPEAAMPPPGPECAALNAAAEAGDAAAAEACVHGGKGAQFTALQLSFALPAAAYATMLVRELLKAPTSAEYHRGIGTHDAAP